MTDSTIEDIRFLEKKIIQSLRIYSGIIKCKEEALTRLNKDIEEREKIARYEVATLEPGRHSEGPYMVKLSSFLDYITLDNGLLDPMYRCIYNESRLIKIFSKANDGYASNVEKTLDYIIKSESQLKKMRVGGELLESMQMLKELIILFKENFAEITNRLEKELQFLKNPTPKLLINFLDSWKEDIKIRENFLQQLSKRYTKLKVFTEMYKEVSGDDIKEAVKEISFGAVAPALVTLPAFVLSLPLFMITKNNAEFTISLFTIIQTVFIGLFEFSTIFSLYESKKEKAEKILLDRLIARWSVKK